MITEKQKSNLVNIVYNMLPYEQRFFNEFLKEEKNYLLSLFEIQTGEKGFYIETNGTSSNPKTQTIFRKIIKF